MASTPDYDPELERRFLAACRVLFGRKNLVGGLDQQVRLYLREGEGELLVSAIEGAPTWTMFDPDDRSTWPPFDVDVLTFTEECLYDVGDLANWTSEPPGWRFTSDGHFGDGPVYWQPLPGPPK